MNGWEAVGGVVLGDSCRWVIMGMAPGDAVGRVEEVAAALHHYFTKA